MGSEITCSANGFSFSDRHIGPKGSELKSMLETIGVDSPEVLIKETIPQDILLEKELWIATDQLTIICLLKIKVFPIWA